MRNESERDQLPSEDRTNDTLKRLQKTYGVTNDTAEEEGIPEQSELEKSVAFHAHQVLEMVPEGSPNTARTREGTALLQKYYFLLTLVDNITPENFQNHLANLEMEMRFFIDSNG